MAEQETTKREHLLYRVKSNESTPLYRLECRVGEDGTYFRSGETIKALASACAGEESIRSALERGSLTTVDKSFSDLEEQPRELQIPVQYQDIWAFLQEYDAALKSLEQ